MFSPLPPTTFTPRITESLSRTRPSKAQKDRESSTPAGGKCGATHRQVDLRAILKTSRLEESLFSLSYLTTHDNELSPRLSWLFLFVEDTQWLSFAFSVYLHKDIPELLNLALDPLRAVPDYDSFVIVNVATILLVFAVVGLIGVVTLVMQRRGKVPLLALRILRLLCALIMTALSIPIATFLMMGVHCVDGKMPKWDTACYTSPHLPLYIFNLLSLVIFVPLLVLGVTLFIETDPASKSPVSKAHSRMDKIDVIVRLVLVLGDVMLYKASEAFHWAFMIISAVLLCYLSFNMSRTQPYYNLATTAFRSGMCMSAAFAMVASMFVRGFVGFDTKGYWVALVPASFLGLVVGASLAYGYNRQFLQRTVRTWHRIMREEESCKSASSSDMSLAPPQQSSAGAISPAPLINSTLANVQDARLNSGGSIPRNRTTSGSGIVRSAPIMSTVASSRAPLRPTGSSPLKSITAASTENSAELLPQHALALAAGKVHESSLEASISPSSNQPRSSSPAANRPGRSHLRESNSENTSGFLLTQGGAQKRSGSSVKLQLAMPTAEESDRVISSVLRGTSTEALNAVRERAPRRRQNVFDSPLEVEVCIRFIRESPTNKQISIGLHLLERGLIEFPSDPMLLLLAATYLSTYYGQEGERVAEGLMKELESSCQVPLDVKFLGYCRERSLRSAGAHVLDKVALDSLDRESRYHHLRAMIALRDAWECVRIHASAERLAEVTAKLAFHRTRASSCYTRLLARNSRDENSLRLFASYLSTVEKDEMRAQQIINLADDVEAHKAIHTDHLEQNLMDSQDELMIPPVPTTPPPEVFRDIKPIHRKGSGDMIVTSGSVPAEGALFYGPDAPPITGTLNRATFHSTVPVGSASGRMLQPLLPRAASHHGSQTSGTSATRVQRQRQSLRRVIEARLTAPLNGASLLGVLLGLFVLSLIVGFVLCLKFMAVSSDSIGVQFTATRIGRRAVIRIVESLRQMVYGTEINSPAEYQFAVTMLEANYLTMVHDVLPVLNRIDASEQKNMPIFRTFARVVVNETRTDYVPMLKTPIELANMVVQVAALALGYSTFGSLTTAVANTVAEFKYAADNMYTAILPASKELPKQGINIYNDLAKQVSTYLVANMVVSLILLASVMVVVYFRVTMAFFERESRVHGLLLGVPKKSAQALVTAMEEDIEGFRAVTQSDDWQDADISLPDINAGSATDSTTGATSDSNTSNKRGGGGGGRAPFPVGYASSRRSRYVTPLIACVIGIGGIVVALYALTLASLDVGADMNRLLDVGDARYHANAWRIIAREFVSPMPAEGWTFSSDTLIQNFRTSLVEGQEIYNRQQADTRGLAVEMPELMVLPRNCSLPKSCNGVQEVPSVGFTKAMASLPFMTEYSRLLDTARFLADQFIGPEARTRIRSSSAFDVWRLLEAISLDIVARCRELEETLQSIILQRTLTSKSWILTTFILLIATSLAAFACFVHFGINRLKREAAVLVLLLHMIPPGMVKDLPELSGFLETGGLTLMT